MASADVPGIGTVFLDGVAEEATMQRILAAIQGQQGGGSQAQVSAAGISQVNRGFINLARQTESTGKDVREGGDTAYLGMIKAGQAGSQFSRQLGRASGNLVRSFETASESPFGFAKALANAGGDLLKESRLGGAAFGALGGYMASLATDLDGLGTTITTSFGAAAGALAPGLVAGATSVIAGFIFEKLDSTSKAFNQVQQSGAILGGSLIEFRKAAHSSNLTMAEYNNVMSKASDSMSMFGGQTLRGAREFARTNQALTNEFSTPLLQMGYSFEDMGVATAEMMERFTLSGMSFDQLAVRTREVAAAAFEQAQQQKVLAAMTGRSIEQQKAAQKAQRQDAQVQAAIARLGPQQQQQVEQLISAFPHLRGAILDQVTFGGAVSQEAMMQLSQFPNAVASVQGAVDGIKNGSGIAIDAFKEQAKNSAAIREEYLNATDTVATLGRFTSNAYVKTAESMIIPQQEMMARAISDTVNKVVEDMKTLTQGGDAATKALIKQQEAQRELNMEISAGITGLLNQTDGIITKVTELTEAATRGVGSVNRMLGVDTTFSAGQNDGRAVPISGSRPSAPATSTTTAMFMPDESDATLNAAGQQLTATGATSAINNNVLGAGMQTGPTETSDPGVQNALTELLKQQKQSNSYLRNLALAAGG